MPLALVNITTVKPGPQIQPLAMYEAEAAKMVRLCRNNFLRLVEKGIIPYVYHADGKRRLYLLEDLIAYLRGREKFTLINGNPPAAKNRKAKKHEC